MLIGCSIARPFPSTWVYDEILSYRTSKFPFLSRPFSWPATIYTIITATARDSRAKCRRKSIPHVPAVTFITWKNLIMKCYKVSCIFSREIVMRCWIIVPHERVPQRVKSQDLCCRAHVHTYTGRSGSYNFFNLSGKLRTEANWFLEKIEVRRGKLLCK